MDRFFVTGSDDKIWIENSDDIDHIRKVLRLKTGDKIETVDEKKTESISQIIEIEKDIIRLNAVEIISEKREAPIEITVFQGIPKAQKMELIVQKSTELGAIKIVPVRLSRCVKDELKDNQIKRLEKIIRHSAMQSKRLIIPEITNPIDFSEMVSSLIEYEKVIILYEDEHKKTIKDVFKGYGDIPKSIAIVIGPEGGISEKEIKTLIKEYDVATLGNRILRTETVAATVIAMINYEFEL